MTSWGPWSFVDGRLVATTDARIPAWDAGALTADGVFETLLVTPTRGAVAVAAHLERLARSLAALGLPACPDLRADLASLLAASADWLAVPRAARLTVTATSRTILLRPFRLERRQGLHLHRLDGARLLPRHKTLAWFPIERLHPAGDDPAFEGAWCDGAHVLEGNTTSLFLVGRDAVVRTAPTSAPILPGIGRARAIERLAALGIAVEERAFTWAELAAAPEAFATSALLVVAPIRAVAGAHKDEGPVTRALRRSFDGLLS